MEISKFNSLKGRTVTVGRGGPESKSGKLLALGKDHLVLHNEKEGVIYYNAELLKSISMTTNDYSDLSPVDPNYVAPYFLQVESFTSVLEGMVNRWVQINRGGPDKIEGVLTNVANDHILLVSKNEMVTIFTYHIKSISYGTNQNKKEENGEKTNKDQENKSQESNVNNSKK